MSALPTVKIASPRSENGYLIINEPDFDEKIHTRYEEKGAKKAAKDETPAPAAE